MVETKKRNAKSYKNRCIVLEAKLEEAQSTIKTLSNQTITPNPVSPVGLTDKGAIKKEVVSAELPTAEATADIQSPENQGIDEANAKREEEAEAEKQAAEEKPVEEEKVVEEAPQTLEIAEEPATEKANPDDYEYSCSKCKELFNKDGNFNAETNLIKCPDCGLELAE